ncbi:MAG: M1 family metallopeptidase, partial [Longimicrobiales bacterium]
PYPVLPPPPYRLAIDQGTRTATGEPGPRYWQQRADYTIHARLDPEAKRVEGTQRVRYHNRSPDRLDVLYVHLLQNFHAPGGIRTEMVELTRGVELLRVTALGQELRLGQRPGYTVDGTVMMLRPPRAIEAGQTITLEFDWAFTVPKAGLGGRMGWDSDNLFYIAYWFPQMAVYDDVYGWHTDQFRGSAEFYSDFGTYDLTLEAPADWIVMASGTLQNADEVLQPRIIERLRRAERSDDVVRVVGPEDFASATLPEDEPGAYLTWRFVADSVRDVAFSATRQSIWDAARTEIGDRDGVGTTEYARVDAFYRESAPLWSEAARYSQHSLAFLARYTDTPYPWQHMSAVEGGGIIGGGMEFPMMTLIGDYNERGDSALYYVIAHELAHMWLPMILSSNERRYSWLDEGTTSYNENRSRMEFFPGPDHDLSDQQTYLARALSGAEAPMLRWSDWVYPEGAFGAASYSKPASVLAALEAMLGTEAFLQAYHAFYDRWAFKHPYPWDLFRTFEDVTGRDLGWFWRAWYYESTEDGLWALEQGIESVESAAEGTRITILDRGWVPMPVDLVITREDGSTERVELPVEPWLEGRVRQSVTVAAGSPVVRVEIDPEQDYPDVVRENNVWVADRAARRPPSNPDVR